MLIAGDMLWTMSVLRGLPILVIVTFQLAVYFFEVHSGAYLLSWRLQGNGLVVRGHPDDTRSILTLDSRSREIRRISINTKDLIGYIRQVLKNDTLASSIAIRTGLPGADDIMFDVMHADYSHTNTPYG
ncbi:hypothetical protein FRC02_002063 [Tulasnella sp. 418]|nr:hypothetical protein FRC02_002063 [Tulasnella sp. 418]